MLLRVYWTLTLLYYKNLFSVVSILVLVFFIYLFTAIATTRIEIFVLFQVHFFEIACRIINNYLNKIHMEFKGFPFIFQ